MIHIIPNGSLDPFADFPQLNTIWPKEYGDIAREAVTEEMQRIHAGKYKPDGQIYLIKDDHEVIGITGYFGWHANVGLRWHGVIPSHRGQGASTMALRWLLTDVYRERPDAEFLIENVPQSEHGKTNIEPYFHKLGFRPVGALESYLWSPDLWQPHHLEIKSFLANEIKKERTPCPR